MVVNIHMVKFYVNDGILNELMWNIHKSVLLSVSIRLLCP